MSVDYFLYSPSRKRSVAVGSIGLGGVQSYPSTPEVVEFIRWAIGEFVDDVRLVTEEVIYADEDAAESSV